MGVREVFEVLYSPVKAFKKIVEKPDFKGILLILVLVMSSVVVEHYVFASKLFVETRPPDDENWTESLALWDSNGNLSLDDADYKAGNHSVKSFVSNGASIWMKIIDIGPLDCSKDTGYKELFFWVKWIHENGVASSNATLRLFSGSESSYFELKLTSFIASNDEWNNATLKIGPDQGWNENNSPDWQSVTGLEFKLFWQAPANLTMKIDGLHFRKYVSPIKTGAFSGTIIGVLFEAIVAFSMNWMLWSLILLIIAKVFREELGPLTRLFLIIGHTFSIAIVCALASAALFSVLPALNLPLDVNAAYALMQERWFSHWAFQLWYYILPFLYYYTYTSPFPFASWIWMTALCTIVIRSLREVTWGRATSISIVAFVIRSILGLFLFPLF